MESISVPTLRTSWLLLARISAVHSCGVFELWSQPDVCRHSGGVIDYDGDARSIRLAERVGFSASGRYKERAQQYLIAVNQLILPVSSQEIQV